MPVSCRTRSTRPDTPTRARWPPERPARLWAMARMPITVESMKVTSERSIARARRSLGGKELDHFPLQLRPHPQVQLPLEA